MSPSISPLNSASTAAGDTERARGSPGDVLGDRGRELGGPGAAPGVVVHASHDGLLGPRDGGCVVASEGRMPVVNLWADWGALPNPKGCPGGLVSRGANRGSGGNWEAGPHGNRLPVGSPTSRWRASPHMIDPVPLRITNAGMVVTPSWDMRSWPQGPMELA